MPHIYVKVDQTLSELQGWLEQHMADIHAVMSRVTRYNQDDVALYIEPFRHNQAFNAMPVEFIFEMGTRHADDCADVAHRCVGALARLGLDAQVVKETADEDWGVWVKSGGQAGFCSCTQWYDSYREKEK